MFINVPIGIVAALLCQRYLPGGGGWLKNQHLDIPGALTSTTGIILLVFGLTNAAGVGFASEWTFIPLAASVLVLGLFLFIESRSKAPLVPLAFVRRGSVLTANALALVLTSIVGGIGFIVPVYFQNVLGYSAFFSGLLTLPPALIFFVVGGWGASRLVNRFGAKRTLLLSSGLISIGTILLTSMSPNGSAFVLMPGLLVWALGASIGFPAVNMAAVAGTRPGEEGLASGLVSTSLKDVKPSWASGNWKPSEPVPQGSVNSSVVLLTCFHRLRGLPSSSGSPSLLQPRALAPQRRIVSSWQ